MTMMFIIIIHQFTTTLQLQQKQLKQQPIPFDNDNKIIITNRNVNNSVNNIINGIQGIVGNITNLSNNTNNNNKTNEVKNSKKFIPRTILSVFILILIPSILIVLIIQYKRQIARKMDLQRYNQRRFPINQYQINNLLNQTLNDQNNKQQQQQQKQQRKQPSRSPPPIPKLDQTFDSFINENSSPDTTTMID
ncbi:hypothetical protein DERP_004272 [Dermatophagoides pteronyssinus]|uniref:Uncharacterized protein n=1 Tax=Dermatophagoides pteronyssinus TaxID=6956 RepID=A0ABQ8J8N2_DERPT|nr:hypothetical protein DERP_004272 [Dermatophagoides pteronyssinus]